MLDILGVNNLPRRNEGGQPGNSNALKFNTPEKRQWLCKQYCEHIKRGYSEDCFPECSIKTFKHYRSLFPVDFPSDMIERAEADRLLFWETLGIHGTAGKLKGFNSRSWEFNMQNRFKWRIRNDVTSQDEKLEPNIIYLPREVGENAKE